MDKTLPMFVLENGRLRRIPQMRRSCFFCSPARISYGEHRRTWADRVTAIAASLAVFAAVATIFVTLFIHRDTREHEKFIYYDTREHENARRRLALINAGWNAVIAYHLAKDKPRFEILFERERDNFDAALRDAVTSLSPNALAKSREFSEELIRADILQGAKSCSQLYGILQALAENIDSALPLNPCDDASTDKK